MLDTDQLRSFLAIVDTGSFTRAALRVNKTQSAVSMHMRRLEEQLGRTLFNKEGRGVRLSQDGETLVDFARQMLRLEAGALAAVSDRALAGRVVLGLPDDYAEWLLPEIVKQFSRLHPMAEISIICDTSDRLVERVAAREIDLAVVTSTLAGNAPFELVLEQPLVWVASRHSSPHDRRPLPLALDGPACGWRTRATTALEAAGISYRMLVVSRSRAAVAPVVEAGLAITVLPLGSVGEKFRVLDEADGLPPLARPTCIGIVQGIGIASREAKALAEVIRNFGAMQRADALLPMQARRGPVANDIAYARPRKRSN